MSREAKVLNGLMERRALEAAFGALAEVDDPARQAELAEQIASHGNAALTMLVAALDNPDPQLRGGLGQVARRLDRPQVVAALKSTALARDRSDQARLAALTLLDRFLGEPVDEGLLAGLQDPEGVAQQSLRELTHAMAHDVFAVIEYLAQLAEQPADVTQMVLAAVPAMPPSPHLVTLLRIFAQSSDAKVAEAAVQHLARTRLPEAVEALDILAQTSNGAVGALAERGRRKLQMSGVSGTDPAYAPDRWQSLISSVDGGGSQLLLFANPAGPEGLGALVSVLIAVPGGIVACSGALGVAESELVFAHQEHDPSAPTVGRVLVVDRAGGAPGLMLVEVPFDVARRLLLEAQLATPAAASPVPAEYRLLSGLIWSAGVPSPDGPAVYAGRPTASDLVALAEHPLLASVQLETPALRRRAIELRHTQALAGEEALIEVLAGEIADATDGVLRARLDRMALWFSSAGQPSLAAAAAAAAGPGAEALPFWQRLVARYLRGEGQPDPARAGQDRT